MKNVSNRQATTILLLAALVMMSVAPVTAMQLASGPKPAQVAPPFEEMLPGVYVYWQWWNESSETAGPVSMDIQTVYNYEYDYYVEDIFGNGYRIHEESDYNSTSVWSFSDLFVTIIFDPDGTFISWLSTQPKQENLWGIFWTPNNNALSGDEVFVYSSFYYSKYNWSYSYKAEYTWTNQFDTPVNPDVVLPLLKEEYQWASSMNAPQSIDSKWHYCIFGYDISEMTLKGNRTEWMQHYFAGLSVFNDTNHNGIMDVAYETMMPSQGSISMPNASDPVMNQTKSELEYSFCAENATLGHIQTPVVNNKKQIEWGAEVTSIEGSLVSPFVEAIGMPVRPENKATPVSNTILTRVDSLKMTYRFELTDEAAVLKIDQYIGDFRNPLGGKVLPQVQGLSLALNYWSSFSSSGLVPLAGTSTTATPLISSPIAEPVATGGLLFIDEGKPLMMIEFGGTYIWGWDNSTNKVGTAVMPMYMFAYPLTASPALTNVVSGAVPMLSGSYYYSSCYGNWSGYSVLHDPVFVAYPGVRPGDVSGTISGIFFYAGVLGVAAVIVLLAVIVRINRVRRSA